jgi:hypothetical protein
MVKLNLVAHDWAYLHTVRILKVLFDNPPQYLVGRSG